MRSTLKVHVYHVLTDLNSQVINLCVLAWHGESSSAGQGSESTAIT
jgi:hypothetical protein